MRRKIRMRFEEIVQAWTNRREKKALRQESPYALCDTCANHGTGNCPNSSLCFALENKPYYQKK